MNPNKQLGQQDNARLTPTSLTNPASLVRPGMLQPPSQMPSGIANSALLSQALAKPPALSTLIRPSSGSSNPSPTLGKLIIVY